MYFSQASAPYTQLIFFSEMKVTENRKRSEVSVLRARTSLPSVATLMVFAEIIF
jgi:hypothetical protein